MVRTDAFQTSETPKRPQVAVQQAKISRLQSCMKHMGKKAYLICLLNLCRYDLCLQYSAEFILASFFYILLDCNFN